MQVVMDYPIHPAFPGQSDDIIQPLLVGRKAGTVDLHITAGDGIDLFVKATVHGLNELAEEPGTGAGLFADNHRPGGFDDLVQLPVGDSHGTARNEDTRSILEGDAFSGRYPFVKFVTKGVDIWVLRLTSS